MEKENYTETNLLAVEKIIGEKEQLQKEVIKYKNMYKYYKGCFERERRYSARRAGEIKKLKEEIKSLKEESNITVFCALTEENQQLKKENEELVYEKTKWVEKHIKNSIQKNKLEKQNEELKTKKCYWEYGYKNLIDETDNKDEYIERLERENKRLKEENVEVSEENSKFYEENQQLKQENEKLK